ncbi:MAG: endolytic transglycosylase MltG [Bacteroidales bacterium]|nr:endolytic transglycosylase MltG [Bacteroidales bacterium]
MKQKKKTFPFIAVAAAIVLGAGLFFAVRYYYDRKVPNFSGTWEVYIYPDTPVDSAVAIICRDCSPKFKGSVRRAFEGVESVKAGHYTIDASNPSMYVSRMLSMGWQTPVKLVLSGSIRKKENIASRIASQMLLDSAEVMAGLSDADLLGQFGFKPSNVFALFIPDTYEVYWTESFKEILTRQKAAYDAFWTDENISRAAKQNLTPMQVSILASIVNGETRYEPEMPAIAGVYLNRLRTGMKLQADPTIAFCFDYEPTRILRKHLEVDSPYNTYKNAGLPPGPIRIPTKAALGAVLNPVRHSYMYFCASPEFNGTHRFASTYSEHLSNARAFQRALTLREKSRAAGK